MIPLLLALATDTVAMLPRAHAMVSATPIDSLAGFCATVWRRDAAALTVYLDALIPAPATNPSCGDGAAVLVRPACLFSISEFMELRLTARYVVLVCRPHAQGIPLRGEGGAKV